MAKTTGPLLSLEAHGSLSKILTYSKKRTGSQARKYNKPTLPASAAQRGQRRLTEFLVAQWINMSDADKATWAANARASGLNLSGYHYFLRTAQRDLYTHHGLVGYWHCNEIVGGKVLDLSGRGNHGTLEPSYPSNAPTLIPSILTRFSNALLYDGIDDLVDCGENLLSDGDWWTIEMCFKPNLLDTTQVIVNNYFDSNGIDLYVDNKFQFWPRIDNGNDYRGFSTTLSKLGRGDCLSMSVGDAGYVRGYVNGVNEYTSASLGAGVTTELTGRFIIGIQSPGKVSHPLNGVIDEICIYKRALSAAEIATRHKFAIRPV